MAGAAVRARCGHGAPHGKHGSSPAAARPWRATACDPPTRPARLGPVHPSAARGQGRTERKAGIRRDARIRPEVPESPCSTSVSSASESAFANALTRSGKTCPEDQRRQAAGHSFLMEATFVDRPLVERSLVRRAGEEGIPAEHQPGDLQPVRPFVGPERIPPVVRIPEDRRQIKLEKLFGHGSSASVVQTPAGAVCPNSTSQSS